MAEAGTRPGFVHTGPREPVRRKKRKLELPREHGFWVMLVAIVLGALLRSGVTLELIGAAFSVVALAVLGGTQLDRVVRRDGVTQVLSSAALGALNLPLDLVAGRNVSVAAITTVAWMSIFAASSIAVRWMLARASCRTSRSAPWLGAASVLLPGVAALFFQAMGESPEASAAVVTTFGLFVIVMLRPSVKQLKPVGLALAALHAVCMVILAAG